MSKTIEQNKGFKWIYVFIIVLLSCTFLLCLNMVMFGPVAFTLRLLTYSFIISLLPSIVISLSGAYNAKFIMIISFIGVIAAFIAMNMEFSRSTGWQDLAGMMMFISVMVIGIVLGIAVELCARFFRRKKLS